MQLVGLLVVAEVVYIPDLKLQIQRLLVMVVRVYQEQVLMLVEEMDLE